MESNLFYTIWFSQRNGSSLLCEGLKSTGIAGVPEELFNAPAGTSLLDHFQVANYQDLQQVLWQKGRTPNRVCGIKVNAPRKEHDPIMEQLKHLSGLATANPTHFEIWNNLFPGGKHIFMTRRNKIRQAVSWWKAIVTQEWHRKAGAKRCYDPNAIRDRYDFAAIHHLLLETSLREAKIQDMLDQAQAVALTLVYEDFIRHYEQSIREVISFLGIQAEGFSVEPPFYHRLADDLSDEWTERFRKELQQDWAEMIW
ncbi:MAG: Stf0 family sulfotransferase [Saprospiraceae bacterium]